MDYKQLQKSHPELYRILAREIGRQRETVNLIASENVVSEAVMQALATPFTNKYAEGKSHARYYSGNRIVDEMEDTVQSLGLKLFKLSGNDWSINVQPYSGSPANLAAYLALLKPGDTVLAMNLGHGGHLTHGSPVSASGKLWKFVHYGVDTDGYLNYDWIEKLAQEHKPRIIMCGATAYSRMIDFKKFGAIAKGTGAYLVADISHIAGLVAGGVHSSPFPYADVVTSTMHKTLRGPRAAFIVSAKRKAQSEKYFISDLIDKAVFPGLQGGPHLNTIFAMAVAFQEALKPSFKKYAVQVVKNAKALAGALEKNGFKIVSGGTDNHLMLVDVVPLGWTGQTAGDALESAGIIVNKNMIPYDTRKPLDPSGIRLGTPAVTTLGMKEKEMKQIAGFIAEVLKEKKSPAETGKGVRALAEKFGK